MYICYNSKVSDISSIQLMPMLASAHRANVRQQKVTKNNLNVTVHHR